jgi:hypothetical protein
MQAKINTSKLTRDYQKIDGLVCAYAYLSHGYFSLVRFTDMTKLLRFFISEDRVDVLRLFVLAFEAVLVTFTDFVVLIISFDAIALYANAPTEITKSIENSIIPEISAYFIFLTC